MLIESSPSYSTFSIRVWHSTGFKGAGGSGSSTSSSQISSSPGY
jgi:hypothetical protein